MRRISLYLIIVLCVSFLLVGLLPDQSNAQSESGWTTPVVIAQTEGELSASVLVPDQSGRLHMFYPDQPDREQPGVINYMRWDGKDWSQPIDVILDPQSSVPGSVRAVIDTKQIMHLVWHGDNNTLRHASAPLGEVASAAAWSVPQTIASSIGTHDVLSGPDGVIYVAYSTYPELGAVSIVRSTSGGTTWSATMTSAAISATETAPHEIRLARDGAGRLHLVWTAYQLPSGDPAVGAFYTRSMDDGVTWEPVQQKAESHHGQIGVGIVGNDEIHLVWRSNIGGDGTFHQRSTDGGKSWFQPDRYDDKGGFSGLPSFAVDSADRLHYVIGPGYYATWDADGLSAYTDVATEEVRNLATTSNGEQAIMAITSGNQLHVVFETDFTTLWYTSKKLGLPPMPTSAAVSAPPSQIDSSAPVAVPTFSPTPTAAAIPTPSTYSSSDGASQTSSSFALIFGIVPALLLVGIVVVTALMRRRS